MTRLVLVVSARLLAGCTGTTASIPVATPTGNPAAWADSIGAVVAFFGTYLK